MSDEPRPTRATEPHDRLTRLAAAMTDALDAHPESAGDEKVIVVLSSATEEVAVTHLHGYDDDSEAVVDLFVHLRAIVRASGRDLEFVGIPDDASALEAPPPIDRLCPGGIGVDVDTARHTARCPSCGSTFTTMMDHPRFSPHRIVGDTIVFPGIPPETTP